MLICALVRTCPVLISLIIHQKYGMFNLMMFFIKPENVVDDTRRTNELTDILMGLIPLQKIWRFFSFGYCWTVKFFPGLRPHVSKVQIVPLDLHKSRRLGVLLSLFSWWCWSVADEKSVRGSKLHVLRVW